jgi:DNA-binding LacI/PurR family transcriptional regulator
VAEFLQALETAANESGCLARLGPIAPASTNRERAALIERVRRGTKRVALVCPEDNITLYLTQAAREAGLSSPSRVGLLSVMGTDVATKAEISCLRYDFRALGRLAVDALARPKPSQHILEPQLVIGKTT